MTSYSEFVISIEPPLLVLYLLVCLYLTPLVSSTVCLPFTVLLGLANFKSVCLYPFNIFLLINELEKDFKIKISIKNFDINNFRSKKKIINYLIKSKKIKT